MKLQSLLSNNLLYILIGCVVFILLYKLFMMNQQIKLLITDVQQMKLNIEKDCKQKQSKQREELKKFWQNQDTDIVNDLLQNQPINIEIPVFQKCFPLESISEEEPLLEEIESDEDLDNEVTEELEKMKNEF
jgi:hypothetical protein